MSKGHKDEVCTFETRRIKKERNDAHENGNRIVISGVQDAPGDTHQRVANGFHGSDILHDLITTKFSGGNNSNNGKQEKIRMIIEEAIGAESKTKVQEVFLRVEQLRIEEKLLLYLRMPSCLTSGSGTIDPLRQPLNPLGNRYEIHQTIMWIKTHLEEDPDVSLPKQEVYDEYNTFCQINSMKPLSTADFGKVMKQVYPRVRPRRLGVRGQSRYCYAGMRKRVKLAVPALPSVKEIQEVEEFDDTITEEMLGAASTLIREWAEGVLGLKFPNLAALARHLVENICVDTQSLAAVCILSATGDALPSTPKVPETPPSLSVTPVAGKPAKLREAQLQLVKKLQQREQTRDQKHQGKTEKIDQGTTKPPPNIQKSKKQKSPISPLISTTPKSTQPPQPPSTSNRSRKLPRSSNQQSVSLQLNCDNKSSINNDDQSLNGAFPPDSGHQKPQKNSRKRPSLDDNQLNPDTSPEKLQKTDKSPKADEKIIQNSKNPRAPGKISVVAPNILKSKLQKIDVDSLKPLQTSRKTNGKVPPGETPEVLIKDEISLLESSKLCAIDPGALDDYLNGGNNSQEQEEELLQYFQQSSSSSSDDIPIPEIPMPSRSDKVSQLRLILQQNLKNSTIPGPSNDPREAPGPQNPQKILEQRLEVQKEEKMILPSLLNQTNNSRRRVSFETTVIEHSPAVTLPTVPQSPNTRRRIFNFTPISPGPHSPINITPNGRAASKPNSANASPFVSPRNTPVPRSRSTMAPCRSSRSSSNGPIPQKTFNRSASCSASYSSRNDDTTFVVPTSGTSGTSGLSGISGMSGISGISGICSIPGKSSAEVQVGGGKTLCSTFLSSDLTPQKQLMINYPSQENLQEIKNIHKRPKPDDQEISEYFNGVKGTFGDNFSRSQSVPLHRMVNPTLMSPISSTSTPYQGLYQFQTSSCSSVAQTPVPSEYNDFEPSCLLDEVGANLMGEDQGFLMEDKEISSENITKILNFLDEDTGKGLNIIDNGPDEIIPGSGIILEGQAEALALPPGILEPGLEQNQVEEMQRGIHTRSYTNTPLPGASQSLVDVTAGVAGGGVSYAGTFDDSSGSRSFPSTPQVYQESNEPMLSSPTLNSLNLRGEGGTSGRAVSDLLESNFLDGEGPEEGLDPLENFEGGFQDDEVLGPLFIGVDGNQ
ncbi:uncharacterized protein [Fopius arisanus]|uniref:RFX5 protein n=1 Tax=Fopius arisanus TaxID=64838 RepID=A0A0C9QCW6_9HYME|nr:PREDICTED: uncharacterized protein LOC105263113 [Fopius arisanus]